MTQGVLQNAPTAPLIPFGGASSRSRVRGESRATFSGRQGAGKHLGATATHAKPRWLPLSESYTPPSGSRLLTQPSVGESAWSTSVKAAPLAVDGPPDTGALPAG